MVIFDASTLILLAKLDLLDIFVAHYRGDIFVPQMVRAEAITKDKYETPSISRHIESNRIIVVKVKNAPLAKKLMTDFSIDAGEAEALVYAMEKKTSVIATDDRNAIRACKMLGIDFVTAIAFLVRAVEKGLVERDDGMFKLRKLQNIGRYSKAIINDAARKIEGGG